MQVVDVRDTIREAITERGYIQSAVAKKARLTPAKLSGILNKSRKLEASELFILCDILHLDPRELMNNALPK